MPSAPNPNKNGVPQKAKLYPKENHPKKTLPLAPTLQRQEAFHSPDDESEEDTEPDEPKEVRHDGKLHQLHSDQQRRNDPVSLPHCFSWGEGIWNAVVCNCKASDNSKHDRDGNR